jgi:sodium/proline symporter
MPSPFTLLIILSAVIGLLVLSAQLFRHSHTAEDFLCARRRVPALFCELSAAFTQVPPWLLIAVALLAHQYGLGALWIAITIWAGVATSFLWLGPRARHRALTYQHYTLARLIDADNRIQKRVAIRRSVAAIAIICLCMSIGCQLTWLLSSLATMLDAPYWLLLGCTVVTLLLSGLLGALWSAIITDALLATLTLFVFAVIAVAAAVHTPADANLSVVLTPIPQVPWHRNVLLIASTVGAAFLTNSTLAQPASFSHLIASRSDKQRPPFIALLWAILTLALALMIGWWARQEGTTLNSFGDIQQLLRQWLHPKFVQALCALLLSIGIAAQLSQCIAMASYFAHDGIGALEDSWQSQSLTRYRWSLVVCLMLVTVYCLIAAPLDTLWFSWHALGAAFAPLLIVRLSGKPIRPGSTLGSIWAGFILTAIFHAMPDTPGDILERGLPFIVAMGIALSGGEQRRNPDRADRGDRTVHDHLPI